MTRAAPLASERTAVALALVAGAVHFASFDIVDRPILTDVRYFLYSAWQVAEGAVPHRDFFAVKTQLASFAGGALHAVGEGVGVDPLLSVRAGYLALATAVAGLVFRVHQQLGRSAISGALGVLAYSSFSLLGILPATGNVPKLLMVLFAYATALLAQRGHWVAAGVVSALAFMDWQVGALAGAGAALAALGQGRARWRCLGRLLAGAGAGLAPFAAYYAATGALAATLRQIGLDALLRGSAPSASERAPYERIWSSLSLVAPGQEWLLGVAVLGIAVLAWRLALRRDERSPLLVVSAVYHVGIVGFSLLDIQGYGDYFALLHSGAFFLALGWDTLRATLLGLATRLPGASALGVARARQAAVFGVVLVAAIAARPSLFHTELSLRAPHARPGLLLSDQRKVAHRLDVLLGDGQLVALESAELLYLSRRASPLPAVYFNGAVWRAFRREDESRLDTATRMLVSSAPDAFIAPDWVVPAGPIAARYERREIRARRGTYWAVVHLRHDRRGASAPRARRSPKAEVEGRGNEQRVAPGADP